MPEWIERVTRMLGFAPRRDETNRRINVELTEADERELARASARIEALDLRVGVLTGRMDDHERKPHH